MNKLIKTDIQYRLHNEEGIVIATSTDGKLSVKNCDVIANGYDLDELADQHIKKYHIVEDSWVIPHESFITGFKQAFEVRGDKKFSEEDIRNAMERVWYWHEDNQDKDCPTLYELISKHIHSPQQTEWDVEIVMETCQVMVQHGDMEFQDFPKLDSAGCLILKRKENGTRKIN